MTLIRYLSYFAWTVPIMALVITIMTIGQPHILVSQHGSNCNYMSLSFNSVGLKAASGRAFYGHCEIFRLFPVRSDV